MIKYLHGKVSAQQWFTPTETEPSEQCKGVLIRKSRGHYVTEPEDIDADLRNAAENINFEVGFTMATETTRIIFSTLQPQQTEVLLPDGSQIQIIDSIIDIASGSVIAKKFQYAALLRQERVLLLWHDDLNKILTHAASIEEKLLTQVRLSKNLCPSALITYLQIWGTGVSPFAPTGRNSCPSSYGFSRSTFASPSGSMTQFQTEPKLPEVTIQSTQDTTDLEDADISSESLARPVVLTSSIYVGLACFLVIVLLLGFTVSNLILETLTDGNRIRLALAACLPVYAIFSIFFAIVLFTDIFQAVGPISSQKINTRFYSPIRPSLQRAFSLGFKPPHITIQMPVYKESLQAVIMPTINSLKASISHYESHGGTASIFVNDDGLEYIDAAEAEARIDFYHDNNIGWVSRPQHGQDGYARKGKFKKASNMNFALDISIKTEERLQNLIDMRLQTEKRETIESSEQFALYRTALADTLKDNPRAKAAGNIRIGEHILIVDSDTRVPVDCLLYGAAEMFLSPEVAIVQHSCGVLQVTNEYFESGITYFTNMIYSAIRFAVGSGEPAPFVGHNAFLRWQAVQSVGQPTSDGYTAFWSESHVSEDFDLAMRLQIEGNICRLASYHGSEFMEGVSLTIYDELNRWEKYAYGCNELVFNPIHTWLWKGPLTKLFLRFLWADLQLSFKITVLGYISSCKYRCCRCYKPS